jgi:LacI family transcriptional regulator
MLQVSQRHIAEKLNLSVATVSRCLRQDPTIPPGTRARVLSLASKVGYRPKTREPDLMMNQTGEASSGTSLVLAAFVQADNINAEENAFRCIAGMSRAAHELGASLVLHNIPFAKRGLIHLPENQPELMRSGKVQGVILVNMFERESVVKLTAQTTCVSIDVQYSNIQMDYVGEENIKSICNAVEYLKSLGHENMGFIDFEHQISSLEERQAGFVLGLMKSELEFRPQYILPCRQRTGNVSDFEIVNSWIEDGVTALVCANDAVAVEVYRWATSQGYHCPEEISITGFDHHSVPSDVPPLTTFSVHFQDLGRLAVERLATRLKQPTLPPIRLMVECELVVGETTGKCLL